jgi:hypothetical protein
VTFFEEIEKHLKIDLESPETPNIQNNLKKERTRLEDSHFPIRKLTTIPSYGISIGAGRWMDG